jgi:hypothetical protein
MAVGFVVVYALIGLAKTGSGGGAIGLQAASLAGQMCLTWGDLVDHARALIIEALPTLFGMVPAPLSAFRMSTDFVGGHFWVWWVVIGVVTICPVRLFSLTKQSDRADFGVYLLLAGVFTALAYPLSCNVTLHTPPLLRYLLLAILIPVGLTAWSLARERSPLWRMVIVTLVCVWSAANLADTIGLLRMTVANPPVSEHHQLADYLIAHRIRYARAIYWDAYMIDFLSRERVTTASTDLIRIPEYQEEVDAHAADAVMLQRLPCSGDERVASWCVQKP